MSLSRLVEVSVLSLTAGASPSWEGTIRAKTIYRGDVVQTRFFELIKP